MSRMLVIIAAALALSGCVSHNPNEGQRTYFTCAGGKEFSYRRVGEAIEVFASGATHRLEAPAAGPYRSDNGAVTFTEEGGRATLTGVYNGPFENCRQQTRWSRFF